MTLDFTNISSAQDLHQYIKQIFNFPDYYGNNLDAFHDCFGDYAMKNKENIQIVGIEQVKKNPDLYNKIIIMISIINDHNIKTTN